MFEDEKFEIVRARSRSRAAPTWAGRQCAPQITSVRDEGIFQDVTVIRHDTKIDLRVTPVEARMRA